MWPEIMVTLPRRYCRVPSSLPMQILEDGDEPRAGLHLLTTSTGKYSIKSGLNKFLITVCKDGTKLREGVQNYAKIITFLQCKPF